MIPAHTPGDDADQKRLALILRQFYLAPATLSALQPVLQLAVELNPDLKGLPIDVELVDRR